MTRTPAMKGGKLGARVAATEGAFSKMVSEQVKAARELVSGC